jgi:hypothetical protein
VAGSHISFLCWLMIIRIMSWSNIGSSSLSWPCLLCLWVMGVNLISLWIIAWKSEKMKLHLKCHSLLDKMKWMPHSHLSLFEVHHILLAPHLTEHQQHQQHHLLGHHNK